VSAWLASQTVELVYFISAIAMAYQFLGRTAIITGAGGAIGRSYALELAKRGCNVVVNDVGSTLSGAAGGSASDSAGIHIHNRVHLMFVIVFC
jgi:hypothetical protein